MRELRHAGNIFVFLGVLMINLPTIVTAFFDIGRSKWEGPNLPHYIKRTTDEYFRNFERLLKLENDIIVYTSYTMLDRLQEYCQHKSNLIIVPVRQWPLCFNGLYGNIRRVQESKEFQSTLLQPYNPEYWNTDYVMVNLLKTWFIREANANQLIKTDMVSWVDFAYARKDEDVPITRWETDFNSEKIHVFSHRDRVPERIDVRNIIDHNEVYLMGCHIVANIKNWLNLYIMMFDNMERLINNDLVDDDQTLLLLSYIQNKGLFEIHYTNQEYWFCLFTNYNA